MSHAAALEMGNADAKSGTFSPASSVRHAQKPPTRRNARAARTRLATYMPHARGLTCARTV
eukprot:3827611-Pleurochrysis_carterae.AAC.2